MPSQACQIVKHCHWHSNVYCWFYKGFLSIWDVCLLPGYHLNQEWTHLTWLMMRLDAGMKKSSTLSKRLPTGWVWTVWWDTLPLAWFITWWTPKDTEVGVKQEPDECTRCWTFTHTSTIPPGMLFPKSVPKLDETLNILFSMCLCVINLLSLLAWYCCWNVGASQSEVMCNLA